MDGTTTTTIIPPACWKFLNIVNNIGPNFKTPFLIFSHDRSYSDLSTTLNSRKSEKRKTMKWWNLYAKFQHGPHKRLVEQKKCTLKTGRHLGQVNRQNNLVRFTVLPINAKEEDAYIPSTKLAELLVGHGAAVCCPICLPLAASSHIWLRSLSTTKRRI